MEHHYLKAKIDKDMLPKISEFTGSWQALPYTPPKKFLGTAWSLTEKLSFLREEKLGRLSLIPTPNFWAAIHPEIVGVPHKTILHLDYTASAQALGFLENYLQDCLKTYGNTHTETSATGKYSTLRFHEAIEIIRKHVHAGDDSFVIPCGYGATGAVERIQKILGLYLSPKGQNLIHQTLKVNLKEAMSQKFVVFVGPTEHHSNDVTWQDAALCKFVRIKAIADGPRINMVDLDHLESQLKAHPDHIKIASFSAASNVTGMISDLQSIGTLLKAHQCLFFVDYAASGPYADINMMRDHIDAIYLSMHKNIGGSNLGILVGKNDIYDCQANPSFGGGGTVTAVTPWEYHFHEKIEDREYPGTPAIRQVWQAALSFQLKEWIGVDKIAAIDHRFTARMLDFMKQHPMIQILGNEDPELRFPIFSFLVKHGNKMLHHTFVAALLNDMFGIQARSGCACAGPFGHELLKITKDLSDKYVKMILNVLNGFKPGWTRIGTHYSLSEDELKYTFLALNGISYFGALYLDQYTFNPYTGEWTHNHGPQTLPHLSIDHAIALHSGQSYLATLADEDSYHAALTQQWQEFLLLTSSKIAGIVIDQASHLSRSQHFDELTMATLPVIQNFLEKFSWDPSEFTTALAQAICPLVTPPGKDIKECRKSIVDSLDELIFYPEKNLHRYHPLDHINPEVDFFYVPKGKVKPEIDPKHFNINTKKSCHPCGIV